MSWFGAPKRVFIVNCDTDLQITDSQPAQSKSPCSWPLNNGSVSGINTEAWGCGASVAPTLVLDAMRIVFATCPLDPLET